MLYTLTYSKDVEQTLARQAKQAGREISAIVNAPELEEGLQLYLQAFFDLDSERPIGFGGAGRIPGSKVREYAKFYELDEHQLDALEYLVGEMDNAYLKRQREKQAAENKSGKS